MGRAGVFVTARPIPSAPRNAAERSALTLVPMLRASLFVVRIWRERARRGAAAFRASVRAVDAERGRVFTRPADIARYLARNCPEEDERVMEPDRYTLKGMVDALREARALAHGQEDLMGRVRAIAHRAAASQHAWLREDMCRPDAEQGFGFHLLHEEADHALAMFVASWLPGRGTPPHDHGTWAVVVGLKGCERNTRWRRLDDGTRPGHASIAIADEHLVGAGDVVAMRSGVIHSVRNEGVGVSVSLHIYGRHVNFTGRSRFDPQAQREMPYQVVTTGGDAPISVPAGGAP